MSRWVKIKSPSFMPTWSSAAAMDQRAGGICSKPTSGRHSKSCWSNRRHICIAASIPKVIWL